MSMSEAGSLFMGYCGKHKIVMLDNCPCPVCAYEELKSENAALKERVRMLDLVNKEVVGVSKPEFHDTSVFGDDDGDLVVKRPTLSQWKSIVHKALAASEPRDEPQTKGGYTP